MTSTNASRPTILLVVTGLLREARLAASNRTLTIAGGGVSARLEARLREIDPSSLAGVVSYGFAGAIDPALAVGDVVCPETVVAPTGERFTADLSVQRTHVSALGADRVPVRLGAVLGVEAPVLGAAAKVSLAASHGAVAVDMESHVAASFAARHRLPFAALRAISDTTERDLPPVAGDAMRPDGSVDVLRVLTGLARSPGQLPGLIRTARDAGVAFRALRRVRGLLGPGLGFDL